jgi:hypothetical protein
MKDKHPQQTKLTNEELQLIEQLRKRPELLERFRSILEISDSAEGPIKKADEIEALLIEEMRRLGNATMTSWASGAEQTLAEQLAQKNPSASVRKKKR